jgi:hypothetical protein
MAPVRFNSPGDFETIRSSVESDSCLVRVWSAMGCSAQPKLGKPLGHVGQVVVIPYAPPALA